MRIIFCGGGTAGHVTPAIAIAEHIKKTYNDAEILFIGRQNGTENSIITKNGFKLETIEIYGLKRKLTLSNVKNILCAFKAVSKAKRIIKEFAPDAVWAPADT